MRPLEAPDAHRAHRAENLDDARVPRPPLLRVRRGGARRRGHLLQVPVARLRGDGARVERGAGVVHGGPRARGGGAPRASTARVERPLFVYGVLEIAVGLACAASPWLFAERRAPVRVDGGRRFLARDAGARTRRPGRRRSCSCRRWRWGRRCRSSRASRGRSRAASVTCRRSTRRTRQAARWGRCSARTRSSRRWASRPAFAPGRWSAWASASPRSLLSSTPARLRALPRSRTRRVAREPLAPAALLLAAAASGLLVFASEVVFVHLLALVDGTSVYVFGLVLAVFLVALSAGACGSRERCARRAKSSALAREPGPRRGSRSRPRCPVWDRLPDVFVALGPLVPEWWQREVVRGLVAALAIGLPAACMGMTFPLVLAAIARRATIAARRPGARPRSTRWRRLPARSSQGFVLLPRLGSQRALRRDRPRLRSRARCSFLHRRSRRIVWASPPPPGCSSSSFRDGTSRASPAGRTCTSRAQPEQGQVVWIDEDVHGGVVTVTRAPRHHDSLDERQVPGRHRLADDPPARLRRHSGDVRAALRPRSRRRAGDRRHTAADGASYPFEHVDLAELSPGIVEAARAFFGEVNGDVLDDPRVHVAARGRAKPARRREGPLRPRHRRADQHLVRRRRQPLQPRVLRDGIGRAEPRAASSRSGSSFIIRRSREVASQMATARAVFAHAAFFIRGQGVLVMSQQPLRARPDADLGDLVLADDTIDAFVDDVRGKTGHRARCARLDRRQSAAGVRDAQEQRRGQGRQGERAREASGPSRRPEVAARLQAR